MRKTILFNLISLDGLFEGENHDLSWHNVDKAFDELSIEQLESAGALIFGRITYELMAAYWPTAEAKQDDPIVAEWMNKLPKYVFSKTLERADWHNTTLISGDAVEEMKLLQKQPGKDIYIFGSANLAETFFQFGLIDEIRVLVNPLILGSGTPLFKPQTAKMHLHLVNTRIFDNGNVLLTYVLANSTSTAKSKVFE